MNDIIKFPSAQVCQTQIYGKRYIENTVVINQRKSHPRLRFISDKAQSDCKKHNTAGFVRCVLTAATSLYRRKLVQTAKPVNDENYITAVRDCCAYKNNICHAYTPLIRSILTNKAFVLGRASSQALRWTAAAQFPADKNLSAAFSCRLSSQLNLFRLPMR